MLKMRKRPACCHYTVKLGPVQGQVCAGCMRRGVQGTCVQRRRQIRPSRLEKAVSATRSARKSGSCAVGKVRRVRHLVLNRPSCTNVGTRTCNFRHPDPGGLLGEFIGNGFGTLAYSRGDTLAWTHATRLDRLRVAVMLKSAKSISCEIRISEFLRVSRRSLLHRARGRIVAPGLLRIGVSGNHAGLAPFHQLLQRHRPTAILVFEGIDLVAD